MAGEHESGGHRLCHRDRPLLPELNAPVGQHHDDEDRLVDHDHRSLSDFATATSGVLAPFTTMLASSSGVSVGVRSLSDPGG